MSTYKTTVDDMEVIVHYSMWKASKGSTDGRYGPKLEPDQPGGIEIESVEQIGGITLPYDKDLWRIILDEIAEDLYQHSISDEP